MGLLFWLSHSSGNLIKRYGQVRRKVERLNTLREPNPGAINKAKKEVEGLKHNCLITLKKRLPPNQVRDINRIIVYCNSQIPILDGLKKRSRVALKSVPKQKPVQPKQLRPVYAKAK